MNSKEKFTNKMAYVLTIQIFNVVCTRCKPVMDMYTFLSMQHCLAEQ